MVLVPVPMPIPSIVAPSTIIIGVFTIASISTIYLLNELLWLASEISSQCR